MVNCQNSRDKGPPEWNSAPGQGWGKYIDSVLGYKYKYINPLSPHDALRHPFTFLKTDSICLQLEVLEQKFPWNLFTNT